MTNCATSPLGFETVLVSGNRWIGRSWRPSRDRSRRDAGGRTAATGDAADHAVVLDQRSWSDGSAVEVDDLGGGPFDAMAKHECTLGGLGPIRSVARRSGDPRTAAARRGSRRAPGARPGVGIEVRFRRPAGTDGDCVIDEAERPSGPARCGTARTVGEPHTIEIPAGWTDDVVGLHREVVERRWGGRRLRRTPRFSTNSRRTRVVDRVGRRRSAAAPRSTHRHQRAGPAASIRCRTPWCLAVDPPWSEGRCPRVRRRVRADTTGPRLPRRRRARRVGSTDASRRMATASVCASTSRGQFEIPTGNTAETGEPLRRCPASRQWEFEFPRVEHSAKASEEPRRIGTATRSIAHGAASRPGCRHVHASSTKPSPLDASSGSACVTGRRPRCASSTVVHSWTCEDVVVAVAGPVGGEEQAVRARAFARAVPAIRPSVGSSK